MIWHTTTHCNTPSDTIHTYTHIYTRAHTMKALTICSTYICMHEYTYVYTYTHIHAPAGTHRSVVYIYIYIYIRITYVHTYIHIHAPAGPQWSVGVRHDRVVQCTCPGSPNILPVGTQVYIRYNINIYRWSIWSIYTYTYDINIYIYLYIRYNLNIYTRRKMCKVIQTRYRGSKY